VKVEDEHPALGWARSGLMALTGSAEGEPQLCPAALPACADGALAALASLAPAGTFDGLRGSPLLAERAAIAGHRRQGAVSPGGACRLLEAADGWIAVNLTRPDDWALAPAWLEHEASGDWPQIAAQVRGRPVEELVERARLLGLAVAEDRLPDTALAQWCKRSTTEAGQEIAGRARQSLSQPFGAPPPVNAGGGSPLVVDLSSLWAGPLCSHLLQRAGAEVIKVESERRPDGARNGPAEFFDLLNAGKRCVAIDPTTPAGRERLLALLRRADIVIEASRPRALRQLGIDAEALLHDNPRLTWLSITGYGREEPQAQWVAFGDDAGIAAGLSSLMHESSGERMFCGDAIADPLTGLHAALAAWSGWLGGGGRLLSVALAEVVAHCLQFELPQTEALRRARAEEWRQQILIAGEPIAPPRARQAVAPAAALGADTAAVLRELDISC
jgi:crotonobetainyl-CoA:carnitine CoA-transferase CaiB-like acyl-CoA transferase